MALPALEDSIAGAAYFYKIAKRDNDALKRDKCNGQIVKIWVLGYQVSMIGGMVALQEALLINRGRTKTRPIRWQNRPDAIGHF